MIRPYRYFIPLVACLLLAACAPPPPLARLEKNATIVALGDSLTSGIGGRGITYPQQLAEIINRNVINAGISGETSAGAKTRVSALITAHQPQLLIICTGGNDFLQRQDSEQTKRNISAMIETAQAANVDVVLIAVPRVLPLPINHSLYGELADTYNLWVEDEVLKTVLHDNRLKSDQVHANSAGYRKIATDVAALLQRAGAIE